MTLDPIPEGRASKNKSAMRGTQMNLLTEQQSIPKLKVKAANKTVNSTRLTMHSKDIAD
jgi:hypothetical protein